MATHTDSDNDASFESDSSGPDYMRWLYNEKYQAVLHQGSCYECGHWKRHYDWYLKHDQLTGHPSLHEARQVHRNAVRRPFESRVESLEQEHREMLQEVAALEQELEQIQMEIEEVEKDQICTTLLSGEATHPSPRPRKRPCLTDTPNRQGRHLESDLGSSTAER